MENKKEQKEIARVFSKGSGLESLGQGLMDSLQNRRTVMEIRDRYHEATSEDEKNKIYKEFNRYVDSVSGESKSEAWEGWQNTNDPWYNPGK